MDLNTVKKDADNACKILINSGEEIIAADGIIYYQTSPGHHFGWKPANLGACFDGYRYYGGKVGNTNAACFSMWDDAKDYQLGAYLHHDVYGRDRIYKIFCIDIDGIGKGEDPFGYGIRADGKIISGKRADEWLEKAISDKD